MNDIRLWKSFAVSFVAVASILSLRLCAAEETQPEDASLLAFTESDPTTQEIMERITRVLENNAEKAWVIYDNQEAMHGAIGTFWSKHHMYCARFHLSQKEMELLQWQFRTADGGDAARGDIVQKLISTYAVQVDAAKKTADSAANMWKVGTLTADDYIDTENRWDQTIANQLKDAKNNLILPLLEDQMIKAEKIVNEFQETEQRSSLATAFARLHAECYLQQKQRELYRFRYEKADGENARRIAGEKLATILEQHRLTTQKLADTCEELFQQRAATMDMRLAAETLRDRAALDALTFQQAKSPDDAEAEADMIDQVAKTLQNHLDDAEKLRAEYEKLYREENVDRSSQAKTNTLGMRQVEYYHLQKQVELLRRQHDYAKDETERKAIAEKLMDVYRRQFRTAQEQAEAARESYEVGTCTIRTYLDCEDMSDRTTLDMLHFMLEKSKE